MKLKSLIALVALVPTLVLAQTGLPSSGVSSTGKPAGMPPAPTSQTVQNTTKAVETVSTAKPNTSPQNPSQATILKDAESTGKNSKEVGAVSDQRLKRDIHELDTMPNGIKLYSFKYLWSDDVYVGVMAQDLLSNPQWKDAVITSNTGYYSVDYSELGTQMMTLGQYQLQQQQSNVAVID